jgi:hypothetical protein
VAQKNGLQHIFRVRSIARDPVSRPKHKSVVRSKGMIDFVRNRDFPFL